MSRLASLKIKAKLLQKAKLKSGKPIALKEAYVILAKSAGYESWREMKNNIEQYALFRPSGASLLYWNNWYSTYEEAKSHQKEGTDFLLPHEQHFFLCGKDHIEALGIPPEDSDLKKVGTDWHFPKDKVAFERLKEKIKRHLAKAQS